MSVVGFPACDPADLTLKPRPPARIELEAAKCEAEEMDELARLMAEASAVANPPQDEVTVVRPPRPTPTAGGITCPAGEGGGPAAAVESADAGVVIAGRLPTPDGRCG